MRAAQVTSLIAKGPNPNVHRRDQFGIDIPLQIKDDLDAPAVFQGRVASPNPAAVPVHTRYKMPRAAEVWQPPPARRWAASPAGALSTEPIDSPILTSHETGPRPLRLSLSKSRMRRAVRRLSEGSGARQKAPVRPMRHAVPGEGQGTLSPLRVRFALIDGPP